jgi:hypothetical protein
VCVCVCVCVCACVCVAEDSVGEQDLVRGGGGGLHAYVRGVRTAVRVCMQRSCNVCVYAWIKQSASACASGRLPPQPQPHTQKTDVALELQALTLPSCAPIYIFPIHIYI